MSIIREKRKEKKLTIAQLAAMIHMPMQNLQRYETGAHKVKNMTLEKGLLLARILEIDPWDLLEEDAQESEE